MLGKRLIFWMGGLISISLGIVLLALVSGRLFYDVSPVVVGGHDGSDYEIYVMQADGRNVTQLTDNLYSDTEPVLSPDETRVVFFSDQDGSRDIYVIDISRRNLIRLTIEIGAAAGLSWSPDSTRIAFLMRNAESDSEDIFVMNVDGSQPINLTNSIVSESFPVWSPIEDVILFQSHQTGMKELYTVNADGSNYHRLTYFDDPEIHIAISIWSPDADKIAFVDENFIYVIHADGTNPMIIGDRPPDSNVYWFSNHQLVFYDSGWYTINIDGTGRLPLNLDWQFDWTITSKYSFSSRWKMPELIPDLPPIADAGADQHTVAEDGNSATITLDASKSYDREGSITIYGWYEGAFSLGSGSSITMPFYIGNHTVTLLLHDDRGNSATDEVIITVLAPPETSE